MRLKSKQDIEEELLKKGFEDRSHLKHLLSTQTYFRQLGPGEHFAVVWHEFQIEVNNFGDKASLRGMWPMRPFKLNTIELPEKPRAGAEPKRAKKIKYDLETFEPYEVEDEL